MAFLALSFFQLYDRDGWQIEYFEPLGMSMLVPADAISFDPATQSFVNFHHTRSSLAYSTGVHRLETAQSVHDYTIEWHALRVEPYSVRRRDFAVSRSEKFDGSVLYTRSDFVDGAWSTVMLSADRADVPVLNAVAASLSVGRARPLTFTTGGRIDIALKQTLDIIREEDGPTGATLEPADQYIQVSSHALLNEAITAARAYQVRFPAVAVYATRSGYYAVVLGTAERADVRNLIAELVGQGAVPSDTYPTAGDGFVDRVWDTSRDAPSSPPASDTAPAQDAPQILGSGTGFFVSSEGHVLTNAHVVDGCIGLTVNGHTAELVSASSDFDLALLNLARPAPKAVATFAAKPARLNSDVTVVGYPLTNLLSGLNVTRGAVSAQMGFQGDAQQMQITAPVQSGNSGGPVLGANGQVVGVVVSKLDAERVAAEFGDTPQNVNFAIRGEIAKLFLAQNGVDALTGQSDLRLSPVDLADRAAQFTVHIECAR